jgi:hypothetical protein
MQNLRIDWSSRGKLNQKGASDWFQSVPGVEAGRKQIGVNQSSDQETTRHFAGNDAPLRS